MSKIEKKLAILLCIFFILINILTISNGIEDTNENILKDSSENENNSNMENTSAKDAIITDINNLVENENNSNIQDTLTNDTIIFNTVDSDVTMDFLDEYKSKKYEFKIWYNTLNDYLKDYGLSEENLKLMATVSMDSNIGKVVGKAYYIRYQGHVFDNPVYIIFFDEKEHVLKATYIEFKYEQILPNVATIKDKYQALTQIELKQDLDTTIYNVFDYYNYFSSIEKFREYVKKCEFSKEEIEDKIDMLERMYDSYVDDKKNDMPKKKYTKKQLIDVYNEYGKELKTKEEDYLAEMVRKNHIQKRLINTEPYSEEYMREMVQNDHINKNNTDIQTTTDSKKVVNEIPNSGSEEFKYISILVGIIIISILGIIVFILIGKTSKNSKI